MPRIKKENNTQTKLIKETKKKEANKRNSKKSKESTKKKSAKKKGSKSKINSIPEEHYFYLVSGQKLKNLKELAEALEYLDYHHFAHHVNEYKNDFATWIQDIFKEYDLAEKLRKTKNKEQSRLIIYKHITSVKN